MNGLISIVCVASGGALGALARFALAQKFDREWLPAGTWLANMSASFLLGVIIVFSNAQSIDTYADLFAEVGFCATLSTFSSIAWQIMEMLRAKRFARALLYALITLLCGMAAFYAGESIAASLR